jgi:hypothetical protein
VSEDLRAAAAAGVLAAEEASGSLLQSIVEVARAIFGARASSVFLHDEAADELVFEAVAGEGAEELVGRRFPSSTGVAGWVLVTRQPLVIEELQEDPRFAKEAAESTGFVPKGLMAVPLLHEERALGVLEVLATARSRPPRSRRWSCWACSRTGPRSRSTCCSGAARARAVLEDEAAKARRWRPSWRRSSPTSSPNDGGAVDRLLRGGREPFSSRRPSTTLSETPREPFGSLADVTGLLRLELVLVVAVRPRRRRRVLVALGGPFVGPCGLARSDSAACGPRRRRPAALR